MDENGRNGDVTHDPFSVTQRQQSIRLTNKPKGLVIFDFFDFR